MCQAFFQKSEKSQKSANLAHSNGIFLDFCTLKKTNAIYISMFFFKTEMLDIFFKPLVSPKKYFQTEFEAHTLQFRSTHEYFKTAEYELQTPTATMFLMDILVIKPQLKCPKSTKIRSLKNAYIHF